MENWVNKVCSSYLHFIYRLFGCTSWVCQLSSSTRRGTKFHQHQKQWPLWTAPELASSLLAYWRRPMQTCKSSRSSRTQLIMESGVTTVRKLFFAWWRAINYIYAVKTIKKIINSAQCRFMGPVKTPKLLWRDRGVVGHLHDIVECNWRIWMDCYCLANIHNDNNSIPLWNADVGEGLGREIQTVSIIIYFNFFFFFQLNDTPAADFCTSELIYE